jgi:hypothetical protein
MGLKGTFNRLRGNDTGNTINALLYVFGEDKRFTRRTMESTGVYFQDKTNRLSYDSSPNAIGNYIRKLNGTSRTLGPVSLAYEPTSHLFSFPHLDWSKEEHKEDVILDTAFAEGIGRAVQREDKQQWMSKLMTILLLAVMGAVLLLLLIAAQSGILNNLADKLPKFFG